VDSVVGSKGHDLVRHYVACHYVAKAGISHDLPAAYHMILWYALLTVERERRAASHSVEVSFSGWSAGGSVDASASKAYLLPLLA